MPLLRLACLKSAANGQPAVTREKATIAAEVPAGSEETFWRAINESHDRHFGSHCQRDEREAALAPGNGWIGIYAEESDIDTFS